ncbi:MAG: ABC transporter permease [Chloroflexi bacterium]|nr:ABC transporter permease [Chloroflexota bacterium]
MRGEDVQASSISGLVTPVSFGQSPSRLRRIRRFFRVVPVASLAVLGLVVLFAVFAPFIAPQDPTKQDLLRAVQPPAWEDGGEMAHLLGTDQLGRDILSRIVYGARLSLELSVIAVVLGGIAGTTLGLLAGYRGGIFDLIIMRFVDLWIAMPSILIGLIWSATFGAGFQTILVVLVLTGWIQYTRVIRGEVLSLRERDYVALAKVAGQGPFAIMRKHLLPNLSGTLVVIATLDFARVILFEAALSFLGIGVQPPTSSWGLMLSDGRELLSVAPWLTLYPGLAILVTVLSINLLGDRLRDHFDPHLRQMA